MAYLHSTAAALSMHRQNRVHRAGGYLLTRPVRRKVRRMVCHAILRRLATTLRPPRHRVGG